MDIERGVLVFSLLFVLAFAASVSAQLPAPTVTFIPDQLSANSSFVMIVDPGTSDPVRISWQVCDLTCQFGSLPFINNRYICYFSDTDEKSTCGPVPFRYSADELGIPYNIEIMTIDADGRKGNATSQVETGGLKIIPEVTIDFDNSIASMLVWIDKPADSVSYKIFDSNFDEKTSGYLPMERIYPTPYYNATVELDAGIYYIAFKAESVSSDFGGGMLKVDMGGFGGSGVVEGVIQADPIDIDVLFESGTEPAFPQNKKLYNTLNQTFNGISVVLPTDISRYVAITIPNSTLVPYQSVFYTISLKNIVSSLDIDTVAEVKSAGGTTLGRIPIEMKISYAGGGSIGDCSGASPGADCLGGICCSGICQKKAECCLDSDCSSSGMCSTSYRCESGGDQSCTTGTCVTDSFFCPVGQEQTGTCRSEGESGICCLGSGECFGKGDTEACSGGGICCSDECVTGDCCNGLHCLPSEICKDNWCSSSGSGTPPGEGMDLTLILIVAVIAAGGIGAWYYFTKVRKSKSTEDKFEDEKSKDVFDDEEFY